MSYVLDALRRAEAERERGHVPGLHTQSLATASPAQDGAAARWAAPVGGLAAGLLVAAGAWWWLAPGAVSAPAAATAPQVRAPAPEVTSAAAPSVAPPATPTPASPARPAATLAVAAAPPLPPVAPPPSAAPATRTAPRPRLQPAPKVSTTPATTATPAKPPARRPAPPSALPTPTSTPTPTQTTAPDPSATPPRVPAEHELPDAVRRELPRLAVGGAVHSSTPSARFVVINGRVLREGDEVTPGLRLERIELRRAVLSWRDTRYAISY